MVNLKRLKEGDLLKALVTNKRTGYNEGDYFRVIKTGHSRWDRMDYADCKTKEGYTIEIMYNYADFELVY